MKNQTKRKNIFAWCFLILLIIGLLALNYIKFFLKQNPNIETHPVESSTQNAINTALKDIVYNFNNSQKVKDYAEQNIVMKATLNQYFIYISYITDTTITYEFSYNNLKLDITVQNDMDNLEKFKKVYGVLIEAVQQRIGNSNNIDPLVEQLFSNEIEFEGITKEVTGQTIHYQMDITKRLVDETKVN